MPKLDDLDKDMQRYDAGGRSDKFEFKRGTNRMRILNFPAILATHFIGGRGGTAAICVGIEEGCPYHGDKTPVDDKGKKKGPSLRLVTYIIDRADGKVKLAELPLSVRYALKDIQDDEETAFEDFPMPFDVKIISDPDNTDPKAKYRLMPGTIRSELTPEEQAAFDAVMKSMTPEEYVEKRKAKQKGEGNYVPREPGQASESAAPEEEAPGDIPF